MNSEELIIHLENVVMDMLETAKRKNADYANSNDPFKNFKQVESLGICSVETGFLARMTDKLSRLSTFVCNGTLSVKDESVHDTLLDLANYCLLMNAYLESKKRKTSSDLPECPQALFF